MINSQKNLPKYFCKLCDYNTSKLTDFNKHESTRKHFLMTKNENLAILGNDKFSTNLANHNCSYCNYTTNSKSSYDKHLLSEKHKKNISGEPKDPKHICSQCNKEYLNYNALWKHKKNCIVINDPQPENLQNTFTPNLIIEILRENKEIQNVLIEQNKELQNKLLEQNAEHHKQIIELTSKQMIVNNNNNNTNSNNTQNNHFNIQFFLNDTCKDAINIDQFIKDIQISISDLENVGNQGYVQGISDIIIKNMRTLGLTKRPMHCTDIKRETIYIKDADKWEKDSEGKPKIKNVISRVAKKNLAKIQDWYKDHPEVTVLDSKDYEMSHKLIRQSFGDGDLDVLQNKVVKQLTKEIHVDKSSNAIV
jgi:DNA polymerase III alpha subunit (gram-positive type)